ncbi:MAG: hypothetical protein IT370_36220 [Deltaproteobacteria bacterium]|nr:hypothetical protein [Deltaproteobacteria bacterium]
MAIPPDLAGLVEDAGTLHGVRVRKQDHSMGDHAILVWEEDRDDGRDDGHKLTRGERVESSFTTTLVVASSDSRVVLLRMLLVNVPRVRTSKGLRERRVVTRVEFVDRSGDKVPELVATGPGKLAPRIYQARVGGLRQIPSSMLRCPLGEAARAPLTVPPLAESMPAVIAAVDRGLGAAFDAQPEVLRCALGDVLLTRDNLGAFADAPLWVQPAPEGFRPDAPGRKGPARAAIWWPKGFIPLRATWRGGEVELDQVPHPKAPPGLSAATWQAVAIVGYRLLALDVVSHRGKRFARLFDTTTTDELVNQRLADREKPALTDTDADGVPELVISAGRTRRALFRHDPATGAWSRAAR